MVRLTDSRTPIVQSIVASTVVRLDNAIRGTNGSSPLTKSFSDNGLGVIFDISIYTMLQNRAELRAYVVPENPVSEFDFFMKSLKDKNDLSITSNDVEAMNDYLGTLGVSADYPFRRT